ncbi:hypothetical protein DSL92_04555 [Billgrantia gudaonensis]|uniref:Uncharacterized protein n=1 Tax=Billgrantia gudaonensis TaxID=376427 RepID=A0A3S0Q198_9GAMM|nr:hypothetical protein DSL92_04555 [Halomonas gudaonensis]
MIGLLLTVIIAVAAFNIVSTLVVVTTGRACRHCHPAHHRRHAALDHGHLHRPGVGHRHHRYRRRGR